MSPYGMLTSFDDPEDFGLPPEVEEKGELRMIEPVTASEAKSKTALELGQIEELAKTIDEMIDKLTGRIAFVLSPGPPSVREDEQEGLPTPLGQKLRAMRNSLAQSLSKMYELYERVDLP